MNVLILDDEQFAIDVLTMLLQKMPFAVDIKGAYTNAQKALALLDEESIDVVFLDMEMIDLHGLETARLIQQKYPHIQIIFITAHAQFAVEAFDVSAVDYLLKPVHEKRLVKALEKVQNVSQSVPIAVFQVYTLGRFRLLDLQQQVVKWRTRKTRELFLYLWFHEERPIPSTVIMDVLWPDAKLEKATANLHTTIYQLRKVLRLSQDEQTVELINNSYLLSLPIESDYTQLKRLLEGPQDATIIQQILNLYIDDFLIEEDYSWAVAEQLKLKQAVLQALQSFVENNTSETLLIWDCLQKMLQLDEYNEEYMQRLLQFLIEQNKRNECQKIYDLICMRMKELGQDVPRAIQQSYREYVK